MSFKGFTGLVTAYCNWSSTDIIWYVLLLTFLTCSQSITLTSVICIFVNVCIPQRYTLYIWKTNKNILFEENISELELGHLLDMGYPLPQRGDFVDHIFLKAQCIARILEHVSPLIMAALSSNSLLIRYPSKDLKDLIISILFLRLQKSAKDKVRFPNWLYLLTKLLLGHRY